jgi:hypothetical protein
MVSIRSGTPYVTDKNRNQPQKEKKTKRKQRRTREAMQRLSVGRVIIRLDQDEIGLIILLQKAHEWYLRKEERAQRWERYLHSPASRCTEESGSCTICMCSMNNKKVRLPCEHTYHQHCIEQWWNTCDDQGSSRGCPTCRFSMD